MNRTLSTVVASAALALTAAPAAGVRCTCSEVIARMSRSSGEPRPRWLDRLAAGTSPVERGLLDVLLRNHERIERVFEEWRAGQGG